MAVTTNASYQETLTDIEDNLGFVPGFMAAVPEDALVHEWPVFKQYTLGETVIPAKYRELLQFGVASSNNCQYCSAFHAGAAELNGATDEEIAEAGLLTSITQRWSAMLHAQQYDFDTFVDEFNEIGAYLSEHQAGD